MEARTLHDFKAYLHKQVGRHYWITPSQVVLKSFHVMTVLKPENIKVRMFDWLRAIAEQELKTYKSLKH